MSSCSFDNKTIYKSAFALDYHRHSLENQEKNTLILHLEQNNSIYEEHLTIKNFECKGHLPRIISVITSFNIDAQEEKNVQTKLLILISDRTQHLPLPQDTVTIRTMFMSKIANSKMNDPVKLRTRD